MKITRQIAKDLSERIEKALRAEFADSEFSVTLNGGRFASNEFKPKVNITTKRDDGLSTKAAAFIKILEYAPATFFGLKAHHLGENFSLRNGETYRFEGYNAKRRKFRFVATRLSDGATYKFTPRTVAIAFGLKVPPEIVFQDNLDLL